ncbi:unnamed protein product [Caenorhabditis auriculariae]|uniref:N-acetyl-D-glucosamine kinase n=1 Tax=Caenorhabditis auriculariae TaxID=2777116 RepID=A0A8S1HAJ5_9PELO|nr:unnamed protein product [Caenorhabditis auriculariae]
MSDQEHWRHTWPSATVLCDFLCANSSLFCGKTVLELGAGATGLAGITAAKLGAHRVFLTDHPSLEEALDLLKRNIKQNDVEDRCEVESLDWDDLRTTESFLASVESLDVVVASDVFFDPSTFQGLVRTIRLLIDSHPRARVIFAYQERDDNWTIADLLKAQNLRANLVRRVDTDRHTIQIGIIDRTDPKRTMFAGIEGGGTGSKLVFVDESGEKRIWSTSIGTNYCLDGVEVVGDRVAQWIRSAAAENDIQLPVRALGMGLSGAEDDEMNNKFVQYLLKTHGDIAEHVHLSSDAVSTVAANFSQQGVVIIAGTGSSCRMLKANGEVKGVGGWGHAIGDGGSAYWTANRAIRMLFDDDDGLEVAKHSVELIRKLLCEHFNIADKVGILDFLYKKFEKPVIAQFTRVLAEHAEDPAIAQIFYESGNILGRHLRAVSRHLDEDDKKEVLVVLVGNLFKSWKLLRQGFSDALTDSGIGKVSFFLPSEEPGIGAAAIAAREVGVDIPHAQNKKLIDEIIF